MTAPQYACQIPLIDCNTPLFDCKLPQFACNIPLPICNIPLSDWTIPLYDSKPCISLQKYAILNEMYPVCLRSEKKHGDLTQFILLAGASIPQMRSYVEEFNISMKSSVQYFVHSKDCSVGENVAHNDLNCISNDPTLVPGLFQVMIVLHCFKL